MIYLKYFEEWKRLLELAKIKSNKFKEEHDKLAMMFKNMAFEEQGEACYLISKYFE